MRVPTFAFLALASAFGQQLEVLNSNLPGLVAGDRQGNWIVADGLPTALGHFISFAFPPTPSTLPSWGAQHK